MPITRKVIFVLLAIIAGISISSPAMAGDYAYLLKFEPGEPKCIVQFDADKDEILRTIQIPQDEGFNNMIIDEKGGCYLASYRNSWSFGRDIYYYDVDQNKIEHILNLGDIYGPSNMALTKDELIVQIMGYSGETRRNGGVIFIDRKTRKITGEVLIQKDNTDYAQADIDFMYFDGIKYLLLTSFYVPESKFSFDKWFQMRDTGDVFVIDVTTKQLVKRIALPIEYKFINGLCKIGDKIYITAFEKGPCDPLEICPSNKELLVYSFDKGILLKKIEISPFALDVVYDRSVNKIYVLHRDDDRPRNTIEIIDPDKDRIIGTLEAHSQLMASVVTPGKIYLTVGGAYITEGHTMPRLLVLDTKKDKFVKQVIGSYQGISINPKY